MRTCYVTKQLEKSAIKPSLSCPLMVLPSFWLTHAYQHSQWQYWYTFCAWSKKAVQSCSRGSFICAFACVNGNLLHPPPFLCKLHIVNTMSLVHIGLHLMLPLAADCCDVSAETLAWRLPVTLADFWSAWVVSTSYALLQRLRTLRTTCFVVFQSLSSHYTAWWTSKQLVVFLSIVCCLIKAFLLPQFCEWVRKSSRLCSICDLGSILEVTKTAAFRSVSPDM